LKTTGLAIISSLPMLPLKKDFCKIVSMHPSNKKTTSWEVVFCLEINFRYFLFLPPLLLALADLLVLAAFFLVGIFILF
jgi:hypothetical protein